MTTAATTATSTTHPTPKWKAGPAPIWKSAAAPTTCPINARPPSPAPSARSTARCSSFAAADDLDTLLASGGSYYLEVTSGDNEGQRFDIVSATGNTITVAGRLQTSRGRRPFNTLAGTRPANLVGDTVAVRRHWTLDEVFPAAGFGASGSHENRRRGPDLRRWRMEPLLAL